MNHLRNIIYVATRSRAHKFCQSWTPTYGAVPGRWAGTRRETRSVSDALDYLEDINPVLDRINA
jgi:hypothetical protein